MKKVVVTGAAGHLGRMLFDHLSANNYAVTGLGLRPARIQISTAPTLRPMVVGQTI